MEVLLVWNTVGGPATPRNRVVGSPGPCKSLHPIHLPGIASPGLGVLWIGHKLCRQEEKESIVSVLTAHIRWSYMDDGVACSMVHAPENSGFRLFFL